MPNTYLSPFWLFDSYAAFFLAYSLCAVWLIVATTNTIAEIHCQAIIHTKRARNTRACLWLSTNNKGRILRVRLWYSTLVINKKH